MKTTDVGSFELEALSSFFEYVCGQPSDHAQHFLHSLLFTRQDIGACTQSTMRGNARAVWCAQGLGQPPIMLIREAALEKWILCGTF